MQLNWPNGIGARVELVNVFQVPEFSPAAASLVWPQEEYKVLQEDAKKALSKLVEKVEEKFNKTHHELNFKAEVFGRLLRGEVDQEVGKYFAECKMNLIVAGLNHSDRLTKTLMGNIAKKIINLEWPVLLIPPGFRFTTPKKIAFATDLNPSDISVLGTLVEFARSFKADILIMHSDNTQNEPNRKNKQIAHFLNLVADKVDYRKIYYRHVNSERVKDGLDWIVENGQIDMLTMLPRKHSFFHHLLKGSYTANMSGHIPIPLLVLPAAHHIPI
ncbi:universal stress protein [Pedobacter sp. KLB.chiD]|uniref:universal stress protein n=1 Tax=Pedobacter sp. KLB.chiD TaxID=3387402 RepID=UPI003999A51E